jgi:hypothetical protein
MNLMVTNNNEEKLKQYSPKFFTKEFVLTLMVNTVAGFLVGYFLI